MDGVIGVGYISAAYLPKSKIGAFKLLNCVLECVGLSVNVSVTRKDKTSSEAVLLLATDYSSVGESQRGPKTGALASSGRQINRPNCFVKTFLLLFLIKTIMYVLSKEQEIIMM